MPRPSSSTLTEPSACSVTDLLAEAGQRLVGGVVDHFLDDVQRVVGAGVHAGRCLTGSRPLRTRIEPSEYVDAVAMGGDSSDGQAGYWF
jgi:hypothetical protein